MLFQKKKRADPFIKKKKKTNLLSSAVSQNSFTVHEQTSFPSKMGSTKPHKHTWTTLFCLFQARHRL